MPANEYLSPAERAKKFSKGVHKASETGARQEAERHAVNQARMNANADVSGSQSEFENLINGKRKPRG